MTTDIYWLQISTSSGFLLVQAPGKSVSRQLMNPCMMLNLVTDAVMDPSVAATRAIVDRCPIDTTEATTRLYSRMCILTRCVVRRQIPSMEACNTISYPKTGHVYSHKIQIFKYGLPIVLDTT